MGSKTHQTAVVIIPPETVWPPIQAIRRQHDRHVRRWMPHITLVYPFRPVDEFDALAAQFAPACASLRPFTVVLSTFHVFQHPRQSYTLWLAPEPGEALLELQTRLWQVVPDCDEVRRRGRGFTPHLSVGQARGRGHMRRLLADLQAAWTPLQFAVSEVSLIWRNDPPDDVFRVGRKVRLDLA